MPNEVSLHVWLVHLKTPFSKIVLSEDEKERVSLIRNEVAKSNFCKTRTALRILLSYYHRCLPEEIVFHYNDSGKPTIAGSLCSFNLSHSHELAVIGIAPVETVGIDIEYTRPYPNMDRIVHRFFSESEIQTFSELPTSLKDAFFYELWTQKEAYTKAEGISIFQGMKQLTLSQKNSFLNRFSGVLPLPHGYVGHYVASSPIQSIKLFEYNEEEIASLAIESFDPL